MCPDLQQALSYKPDGIFLSNGPGDPSAVPSIVETAQSLIGKLPVFGICMGHQVPCKAFERNNLSR